MPKKFFTLLIIALVIFSMNAAIVFANKKGDEMKNLSDTVNNFSWEYYKTLDKTKNIFYSPYGIAAALSIIANGSTGDTQKEILSALSATSTENLNDSFKKFHENVAANYTVNIFKESNLMLVNQNFIGNGINPTFKNVLTNVYGSEIRSADFNGNLEGEKEKISAWVDESTNHFIPKYQSSVTADTIVDILNVVYFKGEWEDKFEAAYTDKSDFTDINGNKSGVDMMSKTFDEKIPYYEDEKYKAVALPYKKNDSDVTAAMYIILPRDDEALNIAESWGNESVDYRKDFLNNLDAAQIFDGEVILTLPKFEMDIKNSLKESLISMGIKCAFTNDAEFSDIIKNVQLKIDSITHQAKVKVDEQGTEAAAVTEINMIAGCAPMPKKSLEFIVDRPFIFVIRDVPSGIDLFAGAVNEIVN
ncbi:MAG: hypothetical protein IKZ58_06840 [Selenomonadaceae bacterium]|nr:hypothetical protein [Selenomonadaceae bacterium]